MNYFFLEPAQAELEDAVRLYEREREGLGQVCRSFGGGPATSTHPSGARRCASLDRCFATAMAAKEKAAQKTIEAQAAPAATPGPDAPKLIEGPVLKRSGMNPMPK